ncbi:MULTISPECIES: MurR/RpiR family transcriptional regulator [Streptomyces]|uniref:MurR/RpiR family transcriptional regulator n=2 Tax=Streptomyces griseiscabiei TaxID=2993540 RepID=A0ABU4L4M1_9ACTN|nr:MULTISPECIES: MurR/RpiR family transcriptional regulator [Streptomyces]MBZ3901345.1 MurR/RpiR family transcriptional regulator [Streptomyces griseiscabiei]MDX2910104.1 MurR/RpiR family transcriptional regulator [Streptomyces griseiscabiei]
MKISDPGDLGEGLIRLRAAVRDHWESLSASERAVAQYLASAPVEQLLFAGAQELGTASGTSNATVVRALQRLGYAGLPALKRELATGFTAAVAPEVRLRQRIAHVGPDLDGIWTDVLDEAQERIDQTRRLTGPDALRAAVTALADAVEIHCFGIAACEPAARHLSLALGRIDRRSRFVNATGFALADHLLALRQGDAVVIFQPGRALHELTVLVERARAVGARVVLVTDELGEEFGDRVDAVLTAPHTPTGITSEALTPLVVADVLLLALTTLDETRAVDTSHQLTVLREQLMPAKGNRKA